MTTHNVDYDFGQDLAGDMPIDLRHLSTDQLQQLGVAQLAYLRPVTVNGARAYAIHAADGRPMAVAGDLTVAVAAIEQQEMVPALVH